MQKYIVNLLLVTVLGFGEAAAQTRFFERGESGGTLAFSLVAEDGGPEASNVATYTFRGLFDVGLVQGAVGGDDDIVNYFVGRIVILRPASPAGIGLELGGLYGRRNEDYGYYFGSAIQRWRKEFSEADARLFYRRRSGPASALVIGLSVFYRYNQFAGWNSLDELVIEQKFGDWGGALDGQFLAFGFLYSGLRLEYAQGGIHGGLESWDTRAIISLGVVVSLGGGPAD